MSNVTTIQQLYDAFGRGLLSFGLDGRMIALVRHQALITEVFDGADFGSRANTHVTTLSDGHGRGVSRTERFRVSGSAALVR